MSLIHICVSFWEFQIALILEMPEIGIEGTGLSNCQMFQRMKQSLKAKETE